MTTALIEGTDTRTTRRPALPKRRKARRSLALVLFTVGLLLIFYVGEQYGEMYAAQQSLGKEWEQQNGANGVAPIGPGGLVRILIPKIRLDAMMVEGTSHRALLRGPGHLAVTPEPGDRGNAILAGHRDTFFRNLDQLEPGDDVYVRRSGREYRYVVNGRTVVDPRDLWVTDKSEDSRLTLITCYPPHFIGPAPLRLVVSAVRVEKSAQDR